MIVSDTGSGIAGEHTAHVFEPFFSTKTTDRRRGSGLGLSVVHAVVKDHNGYIDFETEPGKGTSFYLYFPVTREPLEKETAEETDIPGGTESILVVDDDQGQRDVTVTMLQRLGYQAISVESGEQAVELIRDNPHDLLILDMIMPGGIDGAETYRRIVDIYPGQKAMIVSGYAETERVNEAVRLGAGRFLRKPLSVRTLARAIRDELDESSPEK
jgi:CheY-like chemotaxis protein